MLRAPPKSRPTDRAAQHVLDVVPGKLSGAQQSRQGSPFCVLFVALPLRRCQQRTDRPLVPPGGVRAGHVRPHRRQGRQARRPLQFLPHRLGGGLVVLLALQHVGEDAEPVPALFVVLTGTWVLDAGRWPRFR